MLLCNEIMTKERGRTRSKHAVVTYVQLQDVGRAEGKRQCSTPRSSWEAESRISIILTEENQFNFARVKIECFVMFNSF